MSPTPPQVGRLALGLATLAALALGPGRAQAEQWMATTDSELGACLICHRTPSLAHLDEEGLHLAFVSERYIAERRGSHARLACVSCHVSDEVDTFPHETTSRVDCTQSCHLETALGSRTEFSHASVAERLDRGVHSAEALSELEFDPPLLRPGQSTCLYCHGQPVFPDPPQSAGGWAAAGPPARCASCHDDELALDVDYFRRHTGDRARSPASALRSAEICATCHSDPVLVAQLDQHDAVSSYLRSFHGKASLLGSQTTATCQDCHHDGAGDVHVMLEAADPAGPTHAEQLGETCRSGGCHDTAVRELSSAAAHLDLSPPARTSEYLVMASFVLLTLVVLGVFFALILLELCNEVVRPVDPQHRRLSALARAVLRHPEGRSRLKRQSKGQRVQHWLLATSFLALVLTGMPLKFATHPWAETLVTTLGGVGATRGAHRVAAVVLAVTFGYHVARLLGTFVQRLGERRRLHPEEGPGRAALSVASEHPMALWPRDFAQFAQHFAYLLGLRRRRPEPGRYRFEQKFEYWAVFWGMVVIGLSGAVLWVEAWSPRLLGGRTLDFAYIMHSDEAFLAAIYIAVAHLYAVVLSPRVFPLSRGSLTGDMPAEELAEGHTGHLREVARSLSLPVPTGPDQAGPIAAAMHLARRGYALVLLVVVASLGLQVDRLLQAEVTGVEPLLEVQRLSPRLAAGLLDAAPGDAAPGLGEHTLRRGPATHYHLVESWYRPDPTNGCLGGACHEPLPHAEDPELRSFLNMHAAFVDCQVCHLDDSDLSGVAWLTRDTAAPGPPPALLQLGSTLARPDPPSRAEVLSLLADAVSESDGDPTLVAWSDRLSSVRNIEPYIDRLQESTDLHGPTAYGAKLGLPVERPGTWRSPSPESLAELEAADTSPRKRDDLVEGAHEGLHRPEVRCRRCHGDDADLVDFEGLGYPARRAERLRANPVARLADAIERDEVFYLPALVVREDPAVADTSEVP